MLNSWRTVVGMMLLVWGMLVGAVRADGPATKPAAKPGSLGRAVTAKSSAKYVKPSAEDLAEVEKWDAKRQAEVEKAVKRELPTVETAHFVIHTDWDQREYGFLKDNFEAAYTAVSNQFNIPASENIFMGKLPCYVLHRYPDFAAAAKGLGMKQTLSEDVQGLYVGYTHGLGLMLVHKPDERLIGKDHDLAVRFWKYVLTHEMTHAFVARYISDREVTTWLNEGIAEVIASSRFALDVREEARREATRMRSLDSVFADDDKLRGANMYPVMRTLVEVLIRKDKRAFIRMFDDIKNGKETEAALRDNYGWGYGDLEGVWRRYVGAK